MIQINKLLFFIKFLREDPITCNKRVVDGYIRTGIDADSCY